MSSLAFSIIANILISLLSLVGAVALFRRQLHSPTVMSILVSLAAGVMLGASFFDILPEAFEKESTSIVLSWILIGITTSFLLERFLLWYHHHHEDTHNIRPSAYLVLFGDTIHNLIDGVVIAASFLINPTVGITTALAIAAHEIPQELADFSVLLHAGMKKKQALWYNFMTALTALFGAVAGHLFLSSFDQIIPLALSFTAGMFIYIALADLVPDLHHSKGTYLILTQSLPFICGVLLMMGLVSILPHAHEEQETIDYTSMEYFE